MSLLVPRNRQQTADFVIESIRQLGFNPTPGSRLMRMHRILTKDTGVIPPTHREFRTALEADRDMQYLEFVFEQDHARNAHPGLIERLEMLCKDAALPQDSVKTNRSPGRDTQLELFGAALCQRAGFCPVNYAEPDVTCDVLGTEVGIAYKRLKSQKRTLDRITEARDQIFRSGKLGVIGVETTTALNPGNALLLNPMTDEKLQPIYMQAMRTFVGTHVEKIRAALVNAPVIGVVFHDSILRQERLGEWSVTAMTIQLPLICSTICEMQLCETFMKGYSGALPNIVRLD